MRARIIAIALAGSLLGACGGGNDGGGGDTAGDGAATQDDGSASSATSTLTMRDNDFVPADATIAAGEVELVNEGESPHNFSVEGESINVDVEAGKTVTESIDLAAGTYTMFCELHRAEGMEGTLTVEA
jgi:plastocyanin